MKSSLKPYAALAAIVALFALDAFAARNMYIHFPGVSAAVAIHGVKGLDSARDLATGYAAGKRQHGTITIVKETDAASPMILVAKDHAQVLNGLSLQISDPTGTKNLATMTLDGATVTDVQKIPYPAGTAPGVVRAGHDLEEVTFTFQKITWSHSEALVGDNVIGDQLPLAGWAKVPPTEK